MKKILAIGFAVSLAVSSFAAQITTNVTTGGVVLLSTNRASIYSVEITSDKAVLVELFDQDSLAAPYYGTNYVNAAYPYRTTYATNYVTSYVGNNNFTNWYTNAGVWTLTLTNAASTNALTAAFSAATAANTYSLHTADVLMVNGVAMRTTTNASVVINYRTGL